MVYLSVAKDVRVLPFMRTFPYEFPKIKENFARNYTLSTHSTYTERNGSLYRISSPKSKNNTTY